MTDLVPTNKFVIDWPFHKPLPRCGQEFNAGQLGLAVVTATQDGKPRNKPPFKRVEFEIFPPIT